MWASRHGTLSYQMQPETRVSLSPRTYIISKPAKIPFDLYQHSISYYDSPFIYWVRVSALRLPVR